MATPIGQLGKEDYIKIFKGFLISIGSAAGLAGTDYLVNISDQIDFGTWEVISIACVSTLVNAIRKLCTNTK